MTPKERLMKKMQAQLNKQCKESVNTTAVLYTCSRLKTISSSVFFSNPPKNFIANRSFIHVGCCLRDEKIMVAYLMSTAKIFCVYSKFKDIESYYLSLCCY